MKKYTVFLLVLLGIFSAIQLKAMDFISDVKIASHKNSIDTVLNNLTSDGYNILFTDLNSGAGGDYIYLGYKTTTDVRDAITGFLVMKGGKYATDEPLEVDNKMYFLVPHCNHSYFGNLNNGIEGADSLFLYYTKSGNSEKETEIPCNIGFWTSKNSTPFPPFIFDFVVKNYNKEKNEFHEINFNSGTDGDMIFMNNYNYHSHTYEVSGSSGSHLYATCGQCGFTFFLPTETPKEFYSK